MDNSKMSNVRALHVYFSSCSHLFPSHDSRGCIAISRFPVTAGVAPFHFSRDAMVAEPFYFSLRWPGLHSRNTTL